MSATNASIIERAMKDYTKNMLDEIEKRCDSYCSEILQGAIEARFNAPRSHNFTGNFVNSIVVCLYRQRKPVRAYYAADSLDGPIAVKMTFPRKYRFVKDWEGATSRYIPDVVTNQGYGENDAKNFFQSFTPSGSNIFDIVVAYPTEYANWIEQERQTTGILRAYDHADKVGFTLLGLPRG